MARIQIVPLSDIPLWGRIHIEDEEPPIHDQATEREAMLHGVYRTSERRGPQ